ncbi:MAG: hypothetical protein KI790_05825 [Cyclobacteriaceae bacterium]|nr:hypothetical protein [Cyclobacteriaceae bacterium HetDA_MAG_MS6]
MLSAFQETKLRLFFDILDFDQNGFIEQDDFKAIGENICLMADIDHNHPFHPMIMAASKKAWEDLYAYIDQNRDDKASIYEWLHYADNKIVNCGKDDYEKYLSKVVDHMFIMFDQNHDNFISLKEYLDLFMTFRLEVRYSAKAFAKLDLDRDELISRDELHEAVEQFFRSDNSGDKGNWLFGAWEVRDI